MDHGRAKRLARDYGKTCEELNINPDLKKRLINLCSSMNLNLNVASGKATGGGKFFGYALANFNECQATIEVERNSLNLENLVKISSQLSGALHQSLDFARKHP